MYKTIVAWSIAAAALLSLPAIAGGPLIVDGNGNHAVWPSFRVSNSIRYAIDPGKLGALSHAEAADLVRQSFEAWSNVETSIMKFREENVITQDVSGSNYGNISNLLPSNVNPIIFDDDGEIIDQIFGSGSKQHILGGAIPEFIGRQIVRAEIIYNGLFFESNNSSDREILVTMKHEAGHICGLDHTQHSRHFANNGIDEDDAALSIMYPTTSDNDEFRPELSFDDRIALSNLYPTTNHLPNSGRVTGRVRRGSQQLPGVNVILQSVEDPFLRILTTVTGTFDPGQGAFEFTGVPPGQYHLLVEPVDDIFTRASSVGQYAESLSEDSFVNPVKMEYWNNSDGSTEGRSEATIIEVNQNQTKNNINIQVDSDNATDDEYRFGLTPIGGVMKGFTNNDRILFEPNGNEDRIVLRIEFESSNRYFVEVERERSNGTFERKNFSPIQRQSSLEVELSNNGDLDLDNSRYFIFVATRESRTIAFTLSTTAGIEPTATPTSEPTQTPTPMPTVTPVPISPADVNQDGAVNAADLFSFAQDWQRAHQGQARFMSLFAGSDSGMVDHHDLIAWIEMYLQERAAVLQTIERRNQ